MAAFDVDDAWASDALDFRLLRSGPVTLFHRPRLLDDALAQLTAAGYAVVDVDARHWADTAQAHRALAAALSFPSYYGHNLDALADCLEDVAEGAYGWDAGATGLVVALRGFDRWAVADQRTAHAVADIAAEVAWRGLLVGNRMVWLLQSDDPDLELPALGGRVPDWDDEEWSDDDRRSAR